jgi:hypothetical protein
MKENVVADFKPTDDNPNEELWHKLGCVRLHGISRLFQLEAKISKKAFFFDENKNLRTTTRV